MTTASVILFKASGKYYTEERWAIPSEDAIVMQGGSRGDIYYPGVMRYSPDFRRIGGGAVVVETQEPWGHPAVIPPERLVEDETEPRGPVEGMVYWSRRILAGDDTTAGGSHDLDHAHDELTKAAASYLGVKQ